MVTLALADSSMGDTSETSNERSERTSWARSRRQQPLPVPMSAIRRLEGGLWTGSVQNLVETVVHLNNSEYSWVERLKAEFRPVALTLLSCGSRQ